MRLLATMGANALSHVHQYTIDEETYKSQVSFLALAQAYDIEDIIVIGTAKSKESIGSILEANPNIEMVVIESSNIEEVFQKSLEYFGEDTILDLTQGYRHYPMLTLLSSVFLQNSSSKNIKDIFYAQIKDEKCNPRDASCCYQMTSLLKYLDIANMARIINTFNKTLITLDYDVQSHEFREVKKGLKELTQEMFSNDFEGSKAKAAYVEKLVNAILEDKRLQVVEEHLTQLKKELQRIRHLTRIKESQTLLNVSEYFLKKDILLHSVTLLYESMVAFLDEKIKTNSKCKGEKDTYKRRNCLKKNLRDCRDIHNITDCKKFSKILRRIDKLRNTAAHAHTTSSYQEDLKQELKEAIKIITPIVVS